MALIIQVSWCVRVVCLALALVVGLYGFSPRAIAQPNASSGPTGKPKVLVVLWAGHADNLDVDVAESLEAMGIRLDQTNWRELSWDKARGYHGLVLVGLPSDREDGPHDAIGRRYPGPGMADTLGIVQRFLQEGGGVMLVMDRIGQSRHAYRSATAFAGYFDFKLPIEQIDAPSDVTSRHPRLSNLRYLYTQNVPESPVDGGVEAVWWPAVFGKQETPIYVRKSSPLDFGDSWQVVLRAPAGSRSVPFIHPRESGMNPDELLEHAHRREGGVAEPALMGIREMGPGRLAAFQCKPVFHLTSGKSWLHHGAMTDTGLDGKPSGFLKLMGNTLRWLAEPAMGSDVLGGAELDPQRLLPRVLRDEQRPNWTGAPKHFGRMLDRHAIPPSAPLQRGFVGARSEYAGGAPVAAYADAARDADLDFVVFLDPFNELTDTELEKLRRDCAKLTTDDLLLVPGYWMDSTLGNHVAFFGLDPIYPTQRVISNREPGKFMLQGETKDGEFTRRNVAQLNFMIKNFLGKNNEKVNNIALFNFTEAAKQGGMAMPHAKGSGGIGVAYYDNGELVEWLPDEYLLTNASSMSFVPLSIDLVDSPQEMRSAVEMGHALTHVSAESAREAIDGLSKNHQYESPNVSVSTGPRIHTWPATVRPFIYGSERFVNDRGLDAADLHVTADAGLKEVRIHDGARMVRRYQPGGAKAFKKRLYLSALRQRNLSVVAVDQAGHTAVSFARRTWKAGNELAIVFCGDHVNHCTNNNMRMAHGPAGIPAMHVPHLTNAGHTWDGGPGARQQILPLHGVSFGLATVDGTQQKGDPYQIPRINLGDEAAFQGHYRLQGTAKTGGNPWRGWGPIVRGPIATGEATFSVFGRYSTGVDPTSWGGPGLMGGTFTNLFEQTLEFQTAGNLNEFTLSRHGTPNVDALHATLHTGRDTTIHDNSAALPVNGEVNEPVQRTVPTGSWLAATAPHRGNGMILFNRGAPLTLQVDPRSTELSVALPDGELPIEKGQTHDVAFASIVWPLSEPLADKAALAAVLDYLAEPEGMRLQRGERFDADRLGIIELRADDAGAAEWSLPRPSAYAQDEMPAFVLGMRVHGLNPRWSAGLWQIEGHHGVAIASDGRNAYRPLGVDPKGRAYVPVAMCQAARTHHVAGHPIIAEGKDQTSDKLFIQVTPLTGPYTTGDAEPTRWHVSAHNPTDAAITTTLRRAMDVPGLSFEQATVTVPAGGEVVLHHNAATPQAAQRPSPDVREAQPSTAHALKGCPCP